MMMPSKTNIKFSNINHFVNSIILDFAVPTHNYIQHGCHRLLADGERILHMECHHSFTPILDSRPRSSHPQQGYRRSLCCIYYSSSSDTLHQQSDEILFGHFVITLNAAFDQQLLLADEGYKSSSDTIDLPTPLRKSSRIDHVSSIEHASFGPEPVTP